MQKTQSSGFTLIEILIAVAVVGILLAIGVPSYSGYIIDSRRLDAQVGLRAAAQKMERCRTETFTYVDCKDVTGMPTESPDTYYTIGYGTPTARTFTLTATPATGKSQTKDAECTTLVIDQTGLLTATGSSVTTTEIAGNCW